MCRDNKVILVGGFQEIIELCEVCNKEIIGIIDNSSHKSFYGYKLLGSDNRAKELYGKYKDISLIVTPDAPSIRKKLVQYYSEVGYKFGSLIHPNSNVSKYVKLGKGVVIQSGVNVSSNVIVGDFVKININANIMHDCIIGAYSTLAPNSVVLGRVKIDEFCYIGANATILPDMEINKRAVVGAAAVVTHNVAKSKTVIGNPARELIK